MVDDVLRVGGIKLLQDGHDHGAIGDGGHKGRQPVGNVLTDKGDPVTSLHATAVKQHVQPGDIAGKVAIGQCLACIVISQCWQFPVVDETALINLDQVFLHHSATGL